MAWEDEEPGSCDLSVQLILDLLGLSSFMGVVIVGWVQIYKFCIHLLSACADGRSEAVRRFLMKKVVASSS